MSEIPRTAPMTPLAQWLHDRGIDCDWEYNDSFDVGMGRSYTKDHEPAHERHADELRGILASAFQGKP